MNVICGKAKRDENEESRRRHNKEIHSLYRLCNAVGIIKSIDMSKACSQIGSR